VRVVGCLAFHAVLCYPPTGRDSRAMSPARYWVLEDMKALRCAATRPHRSGGRVACSCSIRPPTITSPTPDRLPSNNGSRKFARRGCATAIGVFTLCCVAAVQRSASLQRPENSTFRQIQRLVSLQSQREFQSRNPQNGGYLTAIGLSQGPITHPPKQA
jgi:hypothetical protein